MLKVLVLIVSLSSVWSQIEVRPPYNYLKPDETPKPYEFDYIAEAIGGVSTRKETADGSGRVVGFYTIKEDDGRSRVVEYEADAGGFRAVVKTNEPGVGNESPASVELYASPPDEYLYRRPVDKPPVRVAEVIPKPPIRLTEEPKPVVEERPRVVSPYYRPRPYYRPPKPPRPYY
ncbi:cuticle protein 16.8-like [Centruroides sculpturatus]|uniref:cuticle protein 16.8-like n=1 Tax=Centruroides sculpturatus TaxID=218467 RepID=UPI000C6D09F9|nr:cuticle protein 16.8-like [Centruroides sculpturatus]